MSEVTALPQGPLACPYQPRLVQVLPDPRSNAIRQYPPLLETTPQPCIGASCAAYKTPSDLAPAMCLAHCAGFTLPPMAPPPAPPKLKLADGDGGQS